MRSSGIKIEPIIKPWLQLLLNTMVSAIRKQSPIAEITRTVKPPKHRRSTKGADQLFKDWVKAYAADKELHSALSKAFKGRMALPSFLPMQKAYANYVKVYRANKKNDFRSHRALETAVNRVRQANKRLWATKAYNLFFALRGPQDAWSRKMQSRSYHGFQY